MDRGNQTTEARKPITKRGWGGWVFFMPASLRRVPCLVDI